MAKDVPNGKTLRENRVWFQNRRAKWRKRERFGQLQSMRAMAAGAGFDVNPLAAAAQVRAPDPYTQAYQTQMASNMTPWGSTAVSQYSAAIAGAPGGSNGSCMTPGANMAGTGNFMGVQSQLGMQSQCAVTMSPASLTSGQASHMMMASCQAAAMDPVFGAHAGVDTERRSTSIAALRLKAREHSAAMDLFSPYPK